MNTVCSVFLCVCIFGVNARAAEHSYVALAPKGSRIEAMAVAGASFASPTSYQPRINKAWSAILARVGANGQLMDVCESTNKQKTLQDYLHREAILGRDTRGGGMALLFATEMAGLM